VTIILGSTTRVSRKRCTRWLEYRRPRADEAVERNMESMKSFIDSLSNGQVTVFAALISALVSALIAATVSIFTTRYTLRHGPNYEEQIQGLHKTIGKLAETQEGFRMQHAAQAEEANKRQAEAERRADAERWKPVATIESKIEGTQHVNRLVLKSHDSFQLLEVSLLSTGNVKLEAYPRTQDWVDSTGFAFPIPHASLNKAAEISPTFVHRDTKFDGKFRYIVQRAKDGAQYTGEIPFHGERAYVQNVCTFKLSG